MLERRRAIGEADGQHPTGPGSISELAAMTATAAVRGARRSTPIPLRATGWLCACVCAYARFVRTRENAEIEETRRQVYRNERKGASRNLIH